ncbi:MAG: hypothetical protein LC798_08340 [Chloroflexi bacterium]|nr:hypothetical protein [Chloroflexota bacterium]
MLDLIDSLLNLIEPGGVIDPDTSLRIATSGTSVDHSGAQPFNLEFDPDRLYAWLVNDRHEVFEAGDPPSERERFSLTVLYVADNRGEQAASRRLRSVSAALDDKAHAYLSRLAANRVLGGAWDDLTAEINPDSIRGFDVRGVGLRPTGWRYQPAAGA